MLNNCQKITIYYRVVRSKMYWNIYHIGLVSNYFSFLAISGNYLPIDTLFTCSLDEIINLRNKCMRNHVSKLLVELKGTT